MSTDKVIWAGELRDSLGPVRVQVVRRGLEVTVLELDREDVWLEVEDDALRAQALEQAVHTLLWAAS